MSVHPFPTEVPRREIESLRQAVRELVGAVHQLSQDVSDTLVLQHIGEDLGRSHVDLIVSLQGTAKQLEDLAIRLEPRMPGSGIVPL